MIASLARPAAAAALAALLAGPAGAQEDGEPLDILAPAPSGAPAGESGRATAIPPPVGPIPTRPPAQDPATAADAGGTAGEGTGAGTDPAAGNGLAVQSLAETPPGWQGPLDPGSGGLGSELWSGTPATLVLHVLNALPPPDGPAQRRLLRRLLLSNSRPPAGVTPPGQGGPGVTPQTLLRARLAALVEMGALDGARSLLDGLDAERRAALLRPRSDLALLAGKLDKACGLASQAEGNGGYWAKLRIVCNLRAGELAKAELTRSVLAESGLKAPLFAALADPLLAGKQPQAKAVLAQAKRFGPVTLALLRQSDLKLALDPATIASPGLLAALARSDRLTDKAELAVAERAVAAGALPATALARRYGALAFDDDALAELLAESEGRARGSAPGEAQRLAKVDPNGPRRRALLFRGAQIELADAPRAEILRLGLLDARRSGHQQLFARTVAPLLRGIEPSGSLAWFAPHAARAYFALGEPGAAARWLALQGGGEPLAREAARADLAPLRPFVAAPRGQRRLPGAAALGLRAWQDALLGRAAPRASALQAPAVPDTALHKALAGELARRRARARLRVGSALHAAFAAPVPTGIWQHLAATPAETTSPPLGEARGLAWQGLRRAARAGRRGETALLALWLLQAAPAAQLPAPALTDPIAALRQVGLAAPARALARSAALATGL